MNRILISQNENNDNTDYVVENGEIVLDDSVISELHYEVTNSYLEAKMIYHKDNLRIKALDDKIIIQSYYTDKDVIGRRIFYMFYIGGLNSFSSVDIIKYLKKDSNVLSRSINPEDEEQILKEDIYTLKTQLGKNKYKIDKSLKTTLLVFLGLLLLGLLINKIK